MSTRRHNHPGPTPSTRAAWYLLLIAAGCVALVQFGRTTLGELSQASRIDRSQEAPSVDPLRASCVELQLLPGIGPGLARSMHREIHTADLATLEDLETLPGIGPVRAARIRGAIAPGTDD